MEFTHCLICTKIYLAKSFVVMEFLCGQSLKRNTSISPYLFQRKSNLIMKQVYLQIAASSLVGVLITSLGMLQRVSKSFTQTTKVDLTQWHNSGVKLLKPSKEILTFQVMNQSMNLLQVTFSRTLFYLFQVLQIRNSCKVFMKELHQKFVNMMKTILSSSSLSLGLILSLLALFNPLVVKSTLKNPFLPITTTLLLILEWNLSSNKE
ncbi:transmembrane protein, putative (macronuclear) [Tetrahymena thermophila SB210]|uniref:Transmembrane protein, putative n=1 Tax=Tetrahymena thermophila (strain SB210) TaxID=312017 RepID=W7XBS5_TETTS|nr:transmembrane protein, putative [Tetrahymena thermophila SB210]EWS73873.1 transmembrane protein, putative [Tetrahymena thermophila SB210]|eukprot:XP_012653620.1 transmembrane protein, putative [Tetrahymena thermophila SB210]